jgi:SAM-dependent methyltransferase
MDQAANLAANAFAGTAVDYARFRPPYPPALLRDILERVGVAGGERLLDLACGPGRIALALASSFAEVWAIDLEPEMIEVAKAEARARGATNTRWTVGKAEDLTAPGRSFDLITIGEAFHRLDQRRVAAQSLGWLKPGGGLATLGSDGILTGSEPWQQIVADRVRHWTRPAFPSGWASTRSATGAGPEHDESVLRDAGFEAVASYDVVRTHEWTIEAIIGYLHSTSVCSRRILGESADAFETDLTAALLAYDASGVYAEAMRFGYTLGRKPL